VGRIAAIINHSSNTYRKESAGHFGFFECENRPETAKALFQAAEAVFIREGLTVSRGPYNPSIHDECGLLVDGFDTPSMVFIPSNPAYYESLVIAAGYEPRRNLYAYRVMLAEQAPKRIVRIIERTERSHKLVVRDLNLHKMDEELETICRLYNIMLDRNWGYYPLALEDLKDSAEGLAFFVETKLIQFVELDGRAVAFSLILPNINEILIKAKKRKGILRLLEVLLQLKLKRRFRKYREMRMAVLGVDPEFRDRGLGAVLYARAFERAFTLGFREVETSWIDEDNEDILRAIRLMGCRLVQTHRLYERTLNRENHENCEKT